VSAEENVEDKSLILSDPRGVTTPSSNLARRGLNLIQSDRMISLTLKSPQVVFNSLGMAFSLIPAGEFIMGESKSALTCQLPCHRVKISQPFYLATHLVTQAQWEAVMGSNPSHFQGRSEHPVERVSWTDVQQFLRRLTDREHMGTYRLPTEAEWEYACRAGSTTSYFCGEEADQLQDYSWYGGSTESTQPVGRKWPNAWGLHDMWGNVWEWCHDGRRTYTGDGVVDPMGPTEAGADRAIRGGSWNSPAHGMRERCGFAPDTRYGHIGFRCARSVPSTSSAERVMPDG
jgi:formylglycine-generating enzyme required for sulfatase activity